MRAFVCVLGLLLMVGVGSVRAAAPVVVCEGRGLKELRGDELPQQTCQSYVVGLAHGLDLTIREFGFKQLFCLGSDVTSAGELYNPVLPALRRQVRESPDTSMFKASLAGLMEAFPCTEKTQRISFQPTSAGAILQWCKTGLEEDTEMKGCASYLFGVGQALVASSGYGKADEWFCPPESGLKSKELMMMLIDTAVEEPAVQQKSAVAVIAQGVREKYSCR